MENGKGDVRESPELEREEEDKDKLRASKGRISDSRFGEGHRRGRKNDTETVGKEQRMEKSWKGREKTKIRMKVKEEG